MLLSTTLPIVAFVTLIKDGTDDNNATPHPVAVDVNDDGFCPPYSVGYLNCLSLVAL